MNILFVVLILLTSCSTKTVETEETFEIILLPDQSTVYLNHNSSLEYQPSFPERKVKLKGEAYFSIVKGEKPFVVSTSMGEIKVLGTEFNVKTEAEQLEVEVERGIVELDVDKEIKKVKKGGRAVYHSVNHSINEGKAKFKFKQWMNELKIEFKKMGKEIKREGRKAGQEFKKVGKDFGKGLK